MSAAHRHLRDNWFIAVFSSGLPLKSLEWEAGVVIHASTSTSQAEVGWLEVWGFHRQILSLKSPLVSPPKSGLSGQSHIVSTVASTQQAAFFDWYSCWNAEQYLSFWSSDLIRLRETWNASWLTFVSWMQSRKVQGRLFQNLARLCVLHCSDCVLLVLLCKQQILRIHFAIWGPERAQVRCPWEGCCPLALLHIPLFSGIGIIH